MEMNESAHIHIDRKVHFVLSKMFFSMILVFCIAFFQGQLNIVILIDLKHSKYLLVSFKVYTQKEFDDAFGLIAKKKKSKYQHCLEPCSAHCHCTRKCVTENMAKFFPFVDMVRTYKKARNPNDRCFDNLTMEEILIIVFLLTYISPLCLTKSGKDSLYFRNIL